MKNFKIVMILVAAVAMFCSCGDPEAPVVALTDSTSATETTFDLANPSLTVTLGLATSDEKGLKSIELTRTSYDANGESLGKPVEFPVPAADYEGMTEYNVSVLDTLTRADVDGAAKVVYEVVVTNKKDVQKEATYTVNVVAPSFTEATFSWERRGGDGTGLDTYGLQWTANQRSPFAVIKPIAGAKLYILGEDSNEKYTAATSLSNITLPAEVTQYKKADMNLANQTLNDVIATTYNGKTFVMNVTKSTVKTENGVVIATITGNVKTFEGTPVAAK